MPGDYWQKFAGLRGFFGYWMAHPGKKLLFQGGEFGQFIEWKWNDSLDWHLPEKYEMHTKMLEYSKELNKFYVDHKEFWQIDFDWGGFEWIDCDDADDSIISFIRRADNGDFVIAICNFTPAVRHGARFGVPEAGTYEEVFNSDAAKFGGSNVINENDIPSQDVPWNNKSYSIQITVPPLATVYIQLKKERPLKGKTVSEKQEIVEAEVVEPKAEEKKKTTRTRKTTAKKTATAKKAVQGEEAAKKAVAKKPAAKKTATKTTAKTATKKTTAKTKTAKTAAKAVPEAIEGEAKPKRRGRPPKKKPEV